MSVIKATVVIPTHNHGPTLFASIASVLGQTEQNFEIFIVGDAVTTETRAVIMQLLETDPRIRFFDNREKSLRTGEVYRNQALKFAKGEIICYLCDDDLWLPNHIESMGLALKDADFAHSLPMYLDANNTYQIIGLDLSNPFYFNLQMSGKSLIALSYVAHTRTSYEKLPYGWRETPKDFYTDFYMWKQFFEQKHCKVTCTKKMTSIKVMSPEMRGIKIEESAELLKQTLEVLSDKYHARKLEQWQLSLATDTILFLHQLLMQANDHINYQTKELEQRSEQNSILQEQVRQQMENLVLKQNKIDELQESINKQSNDMKNLENSLTWRIRKTFLKLPMLAVSLKIIRKLRSRKSYS